MSLPAVFGRRGPCVRRGSWGPQHRGGPWAGSSDWCPHHHRGAWTGQQRALTRPGHPSPGAGRPPVQRRAGGGGRVPGQSPRGSGQATILMAASSDFLPVSSGCACGHRETRRTGPSVPQTPGGPVRGSPPPSLPGTLVSPAVQPWARGRAISSMAQAASSASLSSGLRQPRARPPAVLPGPRVAAEPLVREVPQPQLRAGILSHR